MIVDFSLIFSSYAIRDRILIPFHSYWRHQEIFDGPKSFILTPSISFRRSKSQNLYNILFHVSHLCLFFFCKSIHILLWWQQRFDQSSLHPKKKRSFYKESSSCPDLSIHPKDEIDPLRPHESRQRNKKKNGSIDSILDSKIQLLSPPRRAQANQTVRRS